ncbi:PEP-CTERM sorting domain-containing protein [Massilia antarctica]|uniref:PEP-CTERM sorting domain-containing protein n=1 Tax=Massilia antarctica TaxID=2765360 RepID=A0AA49A8I0_9BURK|nr:PEP-CTERM sorting domain-containing protein [Massilia antarctica]QPI50161.1 PEP-CTERM sorting domain-containing protein [Massilia antarctica]
MHPHLTKLSFCALTALAAVWAPAHAASSTANATIANFRLELVDLDLNDGITPSITFTRQTWSIETRGAGQVQTLDQAGATSIENAFGSAHGTLSDSTVGSTASVNHPLPLDNTYHAYRNDSFRSATFTLSPNTQLIFTAVGTVSQEKLGYFDYASSYVAMQGALWGTPDGVSDSFRNDYGTGEGSASMKLYGSLSSDDRVAEGRFLLQTYAILSGPVTSPVPEPSTYAMLLAGTFVLGAVARRRRAVSAATA